MCLSIPSKIKSIGPEMNTCVVDTMGVERSVLVCLQGRSKLLSNRVILI